MYLYLTLVLLQVLLSSVITIGVALLPLLVLGTTPCSFVNMSWEEASQGIVKSILLLYLA